ncbi:MAG: hypothetical protein QN597_09070 [Nitrososphaeraceae archaeon]|nr:hypothetical protein [Nitrososphaeraceae archaeon]
MDELLRANDNTIILLRQEMFYNSSFPTYPYKLSTINDSFCDYLLVKQIYPTVLGKEI